MLPPRDPVEDIIQGVRSLMRRIALNLMDEAPIISVGMNTPNEIVTTPLGFERINESIIRSRVAQYQVAEAKREQERAARSQKRLVSGMMKLGVSLYAARRVKK